MLIKLMVALALGLAVCTGVVLIAFEAIETGGRLAYFPLKLGILCLGTFSCAYLTTSLVELFR